MLPLPTKQPIKCCLSPSVLLLNAFTFLVIIMKYLKKKVNFISLCPQFYIWCYNSVKSVNFFIRFLVCGHFSIMWNCSIITVIKYCHLLFLLKNDTQAENKYWYCARALCWGLSERRPVSPWRVMSLSMALSFTQSCESSNVVDF